MSMIIQGQLAHIRVVLSLDAKQMKELCDCIQIAQSKGFSVESLVLHCVNLAMQGRSYSSILEYLSN